MAVTTDHIHQLIDALTRDTAACYPGLSLFFITHRLGKLRESIDLAEHDIISHPAGNAARAIIRRHSTSEKSSFLGLAIAKEKKMLGLKSQDHLLGLFNINLDEFENDSQARAHIYHMTWHAIDLYEIREKPEYRQKFKSGPMVPKRSEMNLAKATLQADSFALALSALKQEDDIQGYLSEKRALNALQATTNHKPEDYPAAIVMDSCKIAIDEMTANSQSDNTPLIVRARNLSVDVGHAFDEENIKQWWDFTIPAQDMAWRGFKAEQILSAAIHTSSDPYVRSMGYLVQDITKIEPVESESLLGEYNAFIDPDVLSKLHKEMVDTIFEDAVLQGLEESSNRPFLNAANKLNERLTDGHILGWCSNALQDAAHAFERALLNGASPDQAARMQFEGNKEHPEWKSLTQLGKDIVEQKRQGVAITMGHIAEICHNHPAFAPVLDSLKLTMNDPAYIQKLEASNDLHAIPNMPSPKAPAPSAPTPKAPSPKAPAPSAPAPAAPMMAGPSMGGPSLGGNNRAAQILHQKRLAAQRKAEEQAHRQNKNTEHTE